MSKPNNKLNEPLGIGSPTHTGFNGVLENKNYQSFDKQLIEKNVIGGHIEQNAIGESKQIDMRGEQYNNYAIQTQ